MIVCSAPTLEDNVYQAVVRKEMKGSSHKWYLFDKGSARALSDDMVTTLFVPQILFWERRDE